MNEIKLCSECRHSSGLLCTSKDVYFLYNSVMPYYYHFSPEASYARADEHLCSKDGKHFEPIGGAE